MPNKPIRVECTVMSCKEKEEGQYEELKAGGWKEFHEDLGAAKNNRWRTHLGWCRGCAKKFSVA